MKLLRIQLLVGRSKRAKADGRFLFSLNHAVLPSIFVMGERSDGAFCQFLAPRSVCWPTVGRAAFISSFASRTSKARMRSGDDCDYDRPRDFARFPASFANLSSFGRLSVRPSGQPPPSERVSPPRSPPPSFYASSCFAAAAFLRLAALYRAHK